MQVVPMSIFALFWRSVECRIFQSSASLNETDNYVTHQQRSPISLDCLSYYSSGDLEKSI